VKSCSVEQNKSKLTAFDSNVFFEPLSSRH